MNIISNMVEVHIFKKDRDDLSFLLLKRCNNVLFPGLWQMVNGHIHQGESAVNCALRELKEETGLIPEKLWAAPNVNSFYNSESDCIVLLPVFAALVSDEKEVLISEEHVEYKWLAKQETKKLLAWEGQRKSVELIHSYFTREMSFLNFVEIKF